MENMKKNLQEAFRKNMRYYTMAAALIAIWLIFTLFTGFIFISPRNLSNLFLQTVTVAIVATGMTLVIVTGNIDLSVGSVAGFAGAVGAVLQVKLGWGTLPAMAAALSTGLAIGAWHGFWVAYKKVPAFIVTLASMLAFRGAILGVTGGATISPLSESFKVVGGRYLSPAVSGAFALACVVLFIVADLRKRHRRIQYGFAVPGPGWQAAKLGFFSLVMAAVFSIMIFDQGIPYCVLLLLGIVLVFNFISGHTIFGRRLYAIGGNADAARLSGIDIEKNILQLYMIFGVLTAVAGLVLTARLNAATTSAGINMELDAIAAAVIGGTSLMGGEGTVVGSVVGALIMSSLDNGMSLMNLDITYQYVVKGLVLLLAVWADIAARRK